MSFETLGLGPKLLQSIEESGYTEPTPIQKEAIPQILEGHVCWDCSNRHREDRRIHLAYAANPRASQPRRRAHRQTRALVISTPGIGGSNSR